ncbi:MAG: amino acid adenylation domain-containing protein [Cyanobacteria bacterium J06560_6]
MKNVADIYPLTPVQSGMLFHTLNSHRGGVYVNQFTCELHGEIQPQWLQQAWEQTVARHPVLRTAVLWKGLDQPLQVVRETVTLPWQVLDWQKLTDKEQAVRLKAFLESDRTQGFNLAKAPLLRLILIQLAHGHYQFIWSNHHLLCDGWSLLLIWQDVLTYYQGLASDSPPTLAPVRPFRDFVAYQQQAAGSSTTTRQSPKEFWQNQLAGLHSPTPLPAARPTASVVSHSKNRPYHQQSNQLSETLSQQLSDFARQHRLTLNTLVQGAWALLLYHYSDGDVPSDSGIPQTHQNNSEPYKVTYGSVVSGRPVELNGVETMVGLFINTLPLSVSIDPDQTLLSWLQDRQQQLLDIREYETTPLSDIQKWSSLPNNATDGNALFESIVAFENLTAAPTPQLSFDISNQRYLEQSNYPLALLVFPQQGLDLRLLYDTNRFEVNEEGYSVAIAQLLDHLEQLLTAFITQHQAKLADLPRLTTTEQKQLLSDLLGEHEQKTTNSQCIHQLIEQQAAQSPNAIALTFADQSLTYAQLNQQANRLAHVLRSHNITPGSRVAICQHRSLDLIVSILAVLKSGAAYVPLDPTYPTERLTYCLQDTQPQLLLTQHSITSIGNHSVPVLYIEDLAEEHNGNTQPMADLNNLAQPEDLAYIIYTSGSTGQPKGVMVTHRNLMHSTTARFTLYEQPAARFLLLSSVAFDSSIAGIFWSLAQGGTLVLAPKRIEQDLQQLADLIAQRQITHTLCVPTLYTLLLNAANPQTIESLQTVIVAGEACPISLVRQHYQALPNTLLYNEYGPTEGSVWCSAYQIPSDLTTGPVSIGKAISNAQLYLLTPSLKPVPKGAVGEIYIGGSGVTQGYLNQPKKTAAAYVQVSLLGKSIRLYKTGDLGRYRADGNLEWLGRCDRQVKIRGYRIELDEIEAVLRSQPIVKEATVVAHSTEPSAEAPLIESLVASLKDLPSEQVEQLLTSVQEVH